MKVLYLRVGGVFLLLSLIAGCATPESAERRRAAEADINEILSLSVDQSGKSLARNCLSELEYRDYRALDERYLVFEGRGDQLWVNKLRTRCPDLGYGSVLAIESFSSLRICDGDSFVVSEWFDWPWYRRWPWHWGTAFGTGIQCTLGEFVPVSPDQLAEIEAALERR